MKNIKNRIRIKDIAKLAGVSQGTVDRVLHNRGEVADETRNKILTIIDNLGYTPNLIAKTLASKKHYRLAVLIPFAGDDNPYWEKPLIGINKASEEIRDYNAEVSIYTFNLSDGTAFRSNFERVMSTNPDGLIFSPVFYNSSVDIIKSCEEKQIPYIFIDVNIEGYKNLAYFGQHSVRSGNLAAKLMAYGTGEEAKILIIKMAKQEGTAFHLALREKGFLSYFNSDLKRKKTNITSVDVDYADQANIERILIKKNITISNVDGIFIPNSRAYAISEFLEARTISNIRLIGYDLIERNLHYLEKGIISFLIGQKPEEQGYKSVISLFNFLFSGKQIEKINYSPIDIIMKENLDYYKNLNS
jgi:LacI family transcriptional regulator